VAATGTYWVTARCHKLAVFDPRAPANVTEYVRDSSVLDKYRVGALPMHGSRCPDAAAGGRAGRGGCCMPCCEKWSVPLISDKRLPLISDE
jgi:hypothetical protein